VEQTQCSIEALKTATCTNKHAKKKEKDMTFQQNFSKISGLAALLKYTVRGFVICFYKNIPKVFLFFLQSNIFKGWI